MFTFAYLSSKLVTVIVDVCGISNKSSRQGVFDSRTKRFNKQRYYRFNLSLASVRYIHFPKTCYVRGSF